MITQMGGGELIRIIKRLFFCKKQHCPGGLLMKLFVTLSTRKVACALQMKIFADKAYNNLSFFFLF